MAVEVESLHAIYVRRTASSRKALPNISIPTRIFMPDTEEGLKNDWIMAETIMGDKEEQTPS